MISANDDCTSKSIVRHLNYENTISADSIGTERSHRGNEDNDSANNTVIS